MARSGAETARPSSSSSSSSSSSAHVARPRPAPLAHHVRLRQTIGVAFARAFALTARGVIHLESAERDGVHELIDGLLRRGAREVQTHALRGETIRGHRPRRRHVLQTLRLEETKRRDDIPRGLADVAPQRLDLAREGVAAHERDEVQRFEQTIGAARGGDVREMQRRHPRRQRREDVSVRARVRRALVHLTPERLHQKFLAEVRTLPREMARDALLKRLVRVREFGKRVVREETRASSPRAVAELQRRHGGQKRHRVVANGRGGMHETVQRQDDEFRGGTRRSSRERTRRPRRRFEPGSSPPPTRRVQIRERGEVRGGGLFVRGVTPVQGGVREVGVRVEMVPERASRRAAGAPAPSGAIERLSDPRQHATMRFLASSSNAGPARSAAIASCAACAIAAGCVGSNETPALRPDATLASSISVAPSPSSDAAGGRPNLFRSTEPGSDADVPLHAERRSRYRDIRGEEVRVDIRAAADGGSWTFFRESDERVAPRVGSAEASRAASAAARKPARRRRERSESVRTSVRVRAASFRERRRRAFGDDAEPFPQRARLAIRRLWRRRRDDFSHARRRRRRRRELQTRDLLRPALHRRGRRPRVLHRSVDEREEVFCGGVPSRRARRRGRDGAGRGESKV